MPQENQPQKPKREEKDFLAAYEQYADDIYRHCYFRVYNKELAEDLVQETFIKTWKYIIEGKEIKNIRAFLYKVAVNLIIDHSRKKKALPLEDAKEKDISLRLYSSDEKKMMDNLEYKEIIELMDQLDDHHRQVVIMRHIEGLMPAQIADILEESPNAISIRINQGMNKLREIVEKKYSSGKKNEQ